ncbi:SPOR domain-containing protein [Sphingomonas sp. RS2018]
MKPLFLLHLLSCVPLALCPVAAVAQEVVAAPTPTADALAAQMRLLAASPRNVTALIAAADLSTRLGDAGAAMGFLTRAQAADAADPRILAARANAFVLMERPGEALRLFAQAEGRGVAMASYLSQRGLAYDLIGQSAYAQRDYRRAQADGVDDETTRRLALSLGISGQRNEALTLLDPLVRRNDRAAWRARACVLALSGDVSGAQSIATAMMAGGAALTPFFTRLPTLSIADRAFAVHFGEMTASPARMADARRAPSLAPLPVAAAPVAVALALPPTRPATQPSNRRTIRPGRQPIETASVPTGMTLTARRVETPPATTVAPQVTAPTVTRSTMPTQVAQAGTDWTRALAPLSVALAPVSEPSPPPAAIPPTPASVIASAPQPVAPVVTPAAIRPARVAAAPIRTPETARRNTALLASIIDTISVPKSEVEAPVRSTRRAAAPVVTAATNSAVTGKKKDPSKPVAKPAEKKPVEKKPDPVKAEPERWWVQVAGGANENDLGKAWKAVSAKSDALKGKAAYVTPSRATNRVLSGPFKTQAEAMALVNRLRKDGVSSFAWQSEGGQKVAKLPAK